VRCGALFGVVGFIEQEKEGSWADWSTSKRIFLRSLTDALWFSMVAPMNCSTFSCFTWTSTMVTTMDSTPSSLPRNRKTALQEVAGSFTEIGSAHHKTESDDKPQVVGAFTEENQGGDDSRGILRLFMIASMPSLTNRAPLFQRKKQTPEAMKPR